MQEGKRSVNMALLWFKHPKWYWEVTPCDCHNFEQKLVSWVHSCTCRKQQGKRISASQIRAQPIRWISARACSLPVCCLLLHPNWSQVHFLALTGATSLLLFSPTSNILQYTIYLGKCSDLNLKRKNKREKKLSLLDEVKLLQHRYGNTMKKKKEIFPFLKYCAFKWSSQL